MSILIPKRANNIKNILEELNILPTVLLNIIIDYGTITLNDIWNIIKSDGDIKKSPYFYDIWNFIQSEDINKSFQLILENKKMKLRPEGLSIEMFRMLKDALPLLIEKRNDNIKMIKSIKKDPSDKYHRELMERSIKNYVCQNKI